MESLKLFDVSYSAIEHLPDTFAGLVNLKQLHLSSCKNLTSLPSSIWNLTSLAELSLQQEDMLKIELPDMVKDMELKRLQMTCDVSLWLPVILSLSSLEYLNLVCESKSISPNEPYSLSKLSNLQHLRLSNRTSHECSFPELPLNLTELRIYEYKTLEMLPDLSSLKQLKILSLWRCISLQSIPPLPPHLEILNLLECTSVQDLPDLSILKELRRLELRDCVNLKSNSLKQSFLQVGQHKLHSFKADVPNKKVAEWFSYKSSGNTLSFTIPPNSGDNFFGFLLWIVYKRNGPLLPHVRAVITNRTKDIKLDYHTYLGRNIVEVGEVQSWVEYIRGEKLMESGDRIKISVLSGQVKVKKCGAHVIPRKHC